jgi:hypothetical protein
MTRESVRKAMSTLEQIWKPGEPEGRGMTAADLAVQRGALQRSLERLSVIKTNCAHCVHFEMGACEKHGDVPREFQVVEGQCDDWRYDGVPF